MGGETDQWQPYLFRDHTQIFTAKAYNPSTWFRRRSGPGTCIS
jgi:hypothetical protein